MDKVRMIKVIRSIEITHDDIISRCPNDDSQCERGTAYLSLEKTKDIADELFDKVKLWNTD